MNSQNQLFLAFNWKYMDMQNRGPKKTANTCSMHITSDLKIPKN